jgi:hypothetical protein
MNVKGIAVLIGESGTNDKHQVEASRQGRMFSLLEIFRKGGIATQKMMTDVAGGQVHLGRILWLLYTAATTPPLSF